MGCNFVASGEKFDVDAFLEGSSLDPDLIFHRGQPNPVLTTKKSEWTGFKCVLTRGFARLEEHNPAVIEFLREHQLELARLARYPGVTDLSLDFGYNRVPGVVVQSDSLRRELVALAGSLGIGIELSLYAPAQPAGKQPVRRAKKS